MLIHLFARFGCISNGIVYSMVGIIALLSLLRLKHGGADEGSILKFLETVPLGEVVIWIILLGMLCYVAWRIYEAITDPYRYGKMLNGIVKRAGVALGSVADGLIALSALQSLLGVNQSKLDGTPRAERMMVSKILEWQAGEWLTMILGLIICFTAVMQFFYVIRKDYKDRLQMEKQTKTQKKITNWLAWAGHFARGIILLIIGYFMLSAAFTSNPRDVVNTDKAFDFLGDHVNHFSFVLAAVGTICYGFFMFIMAINYDFD